MWIAIGCLVLAIILGLSLAYYNLQDEESREMRLKARQAQRKRRKRLWNWPI
jgi:hypothetical protein